MAKEQSDYDVGQITLHDCGMPDAGWHTASLLRVVVRACEISPEFVEGCQPWNSRFQRDVATTSAAARLEERGFDTRRLIRRGLGPVLVGGMAGAAVQACIALRTDASAVPPQSASLGQLLLDADPNATYEFGTIDARDHPALLEFIGKLSGWIYGVADLEDLLVWRVPTQEEWQEVEPRPLDQDRAMQWVLDRFLLTYLDEWATTSLHAEYRWIERSARPPVPESEMQLRLTPIDRLNGEIARRAVHADSSASKELALIEVRAAELLREAKFEAAAMLFQGASLAMPESQRVLSDLAFCMIPTKPQLARQMLNTLLDENYDAVLTLSNLVAVNVVIGDLESARRHAKALRDLEPVTKRQCILWDTSTVPPTIIDTEEPANLATTLIDSASA